jgi:hypothetical protein
MYPQIKGAAPWAVILCQFSDVPAPQLPASYYLDFVAGPGKLGLFDYWHDVSYGTIDLSGSIVAGWFPMQYSYRNAWSLSRSAWISEAISLAGHNGIDLFQYYGVLAVINAPADDSALPTVPQTLNGRTKMLGALALNTRDSFGQGNWRWCSRCQGLFYAGNPTSYCPADRGKLGPGHDMTGGKYLLVHDVSVGLPDPVQDNWRWCSRCQGLFYAGNPTSYCPYNQKAHVPLAGGFSYRLVHDLQNFGEQPQWYWCSKCQGLFFGGSQKLIGVCPKDWGTHDAQSQGSANYAMMFDSTHLIDQMGGHEMGHGFGLGHAFDTSNNTCGGNTPGEYCDSWDIMGGSYSFNPGGAYDPAGTSPCASTLYKIGFLSEGRVWTSPPSPSTVSLTALNRADLPGYQMAKIVTSDWIYTVEFRQKTGWDRGVPAEGVLIHQLRTRYTEGQQHWRWCNKCGGLYYAGNARCPAGGAHAHTDSFNYGLPLDDLSVPGQRGWRWCTKCQSLAFYDGSRPPGPCSAGDLHDHSTSGNYTLPHDNSLTTVPTQNRWRHCGKCEVLAYSGNLFPGACAAGGHHDLSSGYDYDVPHDVPPPPLLGSAFQQTWFWCYKCQSLAYAAGYPCPATGLHDDTGSDDYSLPFTRSGASGQSGWKWCLKCQGLFYGGGGRSGACPWGDGHDSSASSDYTLIQDVATVLEQRKWWHCWKCEGLFFWDGTGQPGPCPGGTVLTGGSRHDNTNSSNYSLASFGSERPYLVPATGASSWQPGTTFSDPQRAVKISVNSIDSVKSVATILVGQ